MAVDYPRITMARGFENKSIPASLFLTVSMTFSELNILAQAFLHSKTLPLQFPVSVQDATIEFEGNQREYREAFSNVLVPIAFLLRVTNKLLRDLRKNGEGSDSMGHCVEMLYIDTGVKSSCSTFRIWASDEGRIVEGYRGVGPTSFQIEPLGPEFKNIRAREESKYVINFPR